jgi:hypothetical protein
MRPATDEIPAYVEDLFEAERQAPRPSVEVERRVRGRVAATLAATAAGSATLAGSSAAAATAVGMSAKASGLALGIKLSLVIVGVVGTTGGLAWRQHRTAKSGPADDVHAGSHRGFAPAKAPAQPPVEVVRSVPVVPDEMPAAAEPPREPAVAPCASIAHNIATQPTRGRGTLVKRGADSAGNLARESPLIDQARARVAARDSDRALWFLGRHARKFPNGQLEEEREALWVQALVASGDAGSARARGELFRRRFPRSIQLPIVDAALASME